MSISLNNHEQRIVALEKIKNSLGKIESFTLPNLTTAKTKLDGIDKIMLLNDTRKQISVPDMSNFDFIWIRATHDDGTIPATFDNILIPINVLKQVKTISTWNGASMWNGASKCVLEVSFVNDTTINLYTGDYSVSGVYSPLYFLKIYYIFRYNIYKMLKLISPILKF